MQPCRYPAVKFIRWRRAPRCVRTPPTAYAALGNASPLTTRFPTGATSAVASVAPLPATTSEWTRAWYSGVKPPVGRVQSSGVAGTTKAGESTSGMLFVVSPSSEALKVSEPSGCVGPLVPQKAPGHLGCCFGAPLTTANFGGCTRCALSSAPRFDASDPNTSHIAASPQMAATSPAVMPLSSLTLASAPAMSCFASAALRVSAT
mmetsp:Transcript_27731/g.85947  ORF Transcript_27731/g.85947 Transcript_27731/m.85947 type:complete len:205 (-) Transcript_27731:623-1237(-)